MTDIKTKSPMPVTITSPKWADEDGSSAQDDEMPALEVTDTKCGSTCVGQYVLAGTTSSSQEMPKNYASGSLIISGSLTIGTSEPIIPSPLMSIPTKDDIYDALLATGLIRKPDVDPRQAMAKSANKYERALYQAMYDNPRGCECQRASDANRICMFKATECQHALLVAIVHAMTGGNPTRERIDAIDVGHFISVCKQVDYIHRIHWHCVYSMYLNSYVHMQKYNHKCVDNCVIHSFAFDRTKQADEARRTMGTQFNILVADHMMMYKHFRGRHGDTSGQRATAAPKVRQEKKPKKTSDEAPKDVPKGTPKEASTVLDIKRHPKPKRAAKTSVPNDRPISIAEALGDDLGK